MPAWWEPSKTRPAHTKLHTSEHHLPLAEHQGRKKICASLCKCRGSNRHGLATSTGTLADSDKRQAFVPADIISWRIPVCQSHFLEGTKKSQKTFQKPLDKSLRMWYNIIRCGGIAQLVRAHAWHAWGHWFDPNCLHQQKENFCLPKVLFLFIQAAGLVYHHDAVVYIIKGGKPPLYLITRQRVFSRGLMISTLRLDLLESVWYNLINKEQFGGVRSRIAVRSN